MAEQAAEKQPLTDQQKRVLDFIASFIAKNKIAPTRQEIADEFDFSSVNAAQQHIEALARKGYVVMLHARDSLGRKRGRRGFSRGLALVE